MPLKTARKRFHDDWIDVNSVKFYLDGVVESHTAAFLDPYTDEPSRGFSFWDPGKYKAAVAELDKKGLQLYTHAIGDYAVRTALDAYEFAERENHSKDHRNRVEHVETIAAADIPRFGKLGVIASMQPLHAYPDADTLEVWARNAGRNVPRAPGSGRASRTTAGTMRSAATGRSSRSVRGRVFKRRSPARPATASHPAVLCLQSG